MSAAHRVVIVGGGFGGLTAAKQLRRVPVDLTLVDRRNFHVFQPLLYQVATGGLSPANICAPIRHVLRKQRNTRVILGDVVGFDPKERKVLLADGELFYDSLVIAAGVTNHYFGHDQWETLAPGLKTIEDATLIRTRMFLAFERAEREVDREKMQAWLTFVIVGGGPTGVELAGTLAEIAKDTLSKDFRRVNPADTRILLIEGGDRVLSGFVPKLSARAKRSLERLGVAVRTGTQVTGVERDHVTLSDGQGHHEVPARTVLWAAGVKGSPLAAAVAEAYGAELDRMGRVQVEADLSIVNHANVFVIGDLAHFAHDRDGPLPGIAPVAIQQGIYVARRIVDREAGRPTPPFRYKDKGSMATIGRAAGVVDLGWVQFGGYFAWLGWLFIHLFFLIGFQNKILVMCQWAYNYFTYGRSARLITRTHENPSSPES